MENLKNLVILGILGIIGTFIVVGFFYITTLFVEWTVQSNVRIAIFSIASILIIAGMLYKEIKNF